MLVNTQEWLIDFLRFYRELGFFEEYLHLSNKDLSDLLVQIMAQHGLDLNKECHREDYVVLGYDQKRVWAVAFDSFDSFNFHHAKDIGYGGQLHEEIVNSWANISRGLFSPKDIRSTWQSDQEQINIKFVLTNTSYCLKLEPNLIMPGEDKHYAYTISTLTKLAEYLEPCLKDIEHSFTIWDLGCVAMVIFLTPHEKSIIKEIRDVNFL